MKTYFTFIFILNVILALADVSLGYNLAPLLGRRGAVDDADSERKTRGMRKFLSIIVAVYVLLDCLAYSRQSLVFLIAVTGIIVLDMVGQLVIRRKLRRTFD